LRGVRVALGTRYNPGKRNRRASQNGRVSASPTRAPYRFRFAKRTHLHRCVCGTIAVCVVPWRTAPPRGRAAPAAGARRRARSRAATTRPPADNSNGTFSLGFQYASVKVSRGCNGVFEQEGGAWVPTRSASSSRALVGCPAAAVRACIAAASASYSGRFELSFCPHPHPHAAHHGAGQGRWGGADGGGGVAEREVGSCERSGRGGWYESVAASTNGRDVQLGVRV
jgi:hypothetical protein